MHMLKATALVVPNRLYNHNYTLLQIIKEVMKLKIIMIKIGPVIMF